MRRLAAMALLLVGCGGAGPGLDGTWDSGTRWLRLGAGEYQRADDRGTFSASGETIVFTSACDRGRDEERFEQVDEDRLSLGGVVYRRVGRIDAVTVVVCRH